MNGDLETNLHPFGLGLECETDCANVSIGEFWLFLCLLFSNAQAVNGVSRRVPEPYCLTHDNPKNLDVVKRGVQLDRFALPLFVCRAPFEETEGVLVVELGRRLNPTLLQVHAQPAPPKQVSIERSRGMGVAVEERNNPAFPSLFGAACRNLELSRCQLCGEGTRLLGVRRIVLPKPCRFKSSLARGRVDELDVPEAGRLTIYQRGHAAHTAPTAP